MREYDMPIEEQIKQLAREFKAFDAKLTTLDGKVETMESVLKSTHDLVARTHVLLEDTRDVAKLGLEGVQGLRESTDEKFTAAAKANAEQTDMLKSLIVHVRKRVERVEPTKRRRRT